jgi:hypothetical protein
MLVKEDGRKEDGGPTFHLQDVPCHTACSSRASAWLNTEAGRWRVPSDKNQSCLVPLGDVLSREAKGRGDTWLVCVGGPSPSNHNAGQRCDLAGAGVSVLISTVTELEGSVRTDLLGLKSQSQSTRIETSKTSFTTKL